MQTFHQCKRSLHHPSFGAALVLHNTQTNKVPTHAFLVVAMDIFLLQACKKLTTNENKKTKKQNLKPYCVHTIKVTCCSVTPHLINKTNKV
jgi:hypothetical protein